MNDLDNYFHEVERIGGGSREDVLARVLHLDGAARRHVVRIAPRMDEATVALVEKLDLAVRIRNPGVHYVERSTFLGYRREGDVGTPVGARSQIFLSVVPKTTYLRLVFVLPASRAMPPSVQVLNERGHHGVGTHQFIVRNTRDVGRFVTEFEDLLQCQ